MFGTMVGTPQSKLVVNLVPVSFYYVVDCIWISFDVILSSSVRVCQAFGCMWILFDTILSRPAGGSGSHFARMDRRRSSMEDHRDESQDARSMGQIQIYRTSFHRYKPAKSTANNRLLQICLGLQEDGNILQVAGKGHEQMEGHDPGGCNEKTGPGKN